jgi:hypothetical protein
MDEIEFKDLPTSYRLSQRGMLAAVVTLMFSRTLAAPQWPIAAQCVLGGLIGCIVAFALFAASYVVIRYPYLSLVSTRDGDIFTQQFTSKTLARVTKFVSLATLSILLLALIYVAWTKGITGALQAFSLAYIAILFCFVLYLCFFYDAEIHPTVATFIHSTLGLGIILVPFFIPVLVVASSRCRGLLEDEIARQQATL